MTQTKQANNVLFVEDDIDDCNFISEAFSKINAREKLTILNSGPSLLEHLNSIPDPIFYPSLIVIDYYLPQMDGEEVLKTLKQHVKFQSIPVIIYSSVISPELKDRFCELGAKYYYQKVGNFSNAVQFAKALKMFSEQSSSQPSINQFKSDSNKINNN